MKKLLIVLAMLVLLSGCAKKEAVKPSLPDEPIDVRGNRLVYYHGEKDVPLSFAADGKQQIESGIYWHYELDSWMEQSVEGPFYLYDAENLELCDSVETNEAVDQERFITNGGWALFLNPDHLTYSTKEQSSIDKQMIQGAAKHLKVNSIEDVQPIIAETWRCDLDTDGEDEYIFLAEDWSKDAANYSFIGIMDGENCQILCGSIYPDYQEREKPLLKPMVCDLNGSGSWAVMIYKNCEYESFEIFFCESENYIKGYEIIF